MSPPKPIKSKDITQFVRTQDNVVHANDIHFPLAKKNKNNKRWLLLKENPMSCLELERTYVAVVMGELLRALLPDVIPKSRVIYKDGKVIRIVSKYFEGLTSATQVLWNKDRLDLNKMAAKQKELAVLMAATYIFANDDAHLGNFGQIKNNRGEAQLVAYDFEMLLYDWLVKRGLKSFVGHHSYSETPPRGDRCSITRKDLAEFPNIEDSLPYNWFNFIRSESTHVNFLKKLNTEPEFTSAAHLFFLKALVVDQKIIGQVLDAHIIETEGEISLAAGIKHYVGKRLDILLHELLYVDSFIENVKAHFDAYAIEIVSSFEQYNATYKNKQKNSACLVDIQAVKKRLSALRAIVLHHDEIRKFNTEMARLASDPILAGKRKLLHAECMQRLTMYYRSEDEAAQQANLSTINYITRTLITNGDATPDKSTPAEVIPVMQQTQCLAEETRIYNIAISEQHLQKLGRFGKHPYVILIGRQLNDLLEYCKSHKQIEYSNILSAVNIYVEAILEDLSYARYELSPILLDGIKQYGVTFNETDTIAQNLKSLVSRHYKRLIDSLNIVKGKITAACKAHHDAETILLIQINSAQQYLERQGLHAFNHIVSLYKMITIVLNDMDSEVRPTHCLVQAMQQCRMLKLPEGAIAASMPELEKIINNYLDFIQTRRNMIDLNYRPCYQEVFNAVSAMRGSGLHLQAVFSIQRCFAKLGKGRSASIHYMIKEISIYAKTNQRLEIYIKQINDALNPNLSEVNLSQLFCYVTSVYVNCAKNTLGAGLLFRENQVRPSQDFWQYALKAKQDTIDWVFNWYDNIWVFKTLPEHYRMQINLVVDYLKNDGHSLLDQVDIAYTLRSAVSRLYDNINEGSAYTDNLSDAMRCFYFNLPPELSDLKSDVCLNSIKTIMGKLRAVKLNPFYLSTYQLFINYVEDNKIDPQKCSMLVVALQHIKLLERSASPLQLDVKTDLTASLKINGYEQVADIINKSIFSHDNVAACLSMQTGDEAYMRSKLKSLDNAASVTHNVITFGRGGFLNLVKTSTSPLATTHRLN